MFAVTSINLNVWEQINIITQEIFSLNKNITLNHTKYKIYTPYRTQSRNEEYFWATWAWIIEIYNTEGMNINRRYERTARNIHNIIWNKERINNVMEQAELVAI